MSFIYSKFSPNIPCQQYPWQYFKLPCLKWREHSPHSKMPGDKWKDEDVALLLHVWADVNVQDKLTKGKKAGKTSEVYNTILSSW